MGLGADLREDTVYPTSYLDADGNPYDSANKDVMRFEKGQLPPTKESNWLPTPPGQFNLTVRNYFPKEAAYDGTYQVPPVRIVK